MFAHCSEIIHPSPNTLARVCVSSMCVLQKWMNMYLFSFLFRLTPAVAQAPCQQATTMLRFILVLRQCGRFVNTDCQRLCQPERVIRACVRNRCCSLRIWRSLESTVWHKNTKLWVSWPLAVSHSQGFISYNTAAYFTRFSSVCVLLCVLRWL